MKRTRQVFHYDADAVPTDISGCRQFHGEDLRKYLNLCYLLFSCKNQTSDSHNNGKNARKYITKLRLRTVVVTQFWLKPLNPNSLCFLAFQDRMKDQAMTQKEWVFEQKYEKNMIKKDETDEER